MAANETEPSLNSSGPGFPAVSACSLLGSFTWREKYLTPTNFILIAVAISVELLILPITVLSNAMVIYFVRRKPYLRKQKPCVLLACLAATDLLVGAVVLPLVITGHIMRLVGAGPICIMDRIAVEATYITCGASLLHLVIISGERYVAIKHALRYETLVTTRRLTVAIAVAWAISVSSTILAVILTENTVLMELYSDITTLLVVLGSVAVVSFFQVAVYLESRRHRNHIMAHQVSEPAAREILKKNKAAKTTTMIVGALCLCYAPATICQAVALIVSNVPMSVVVGSTSMAEAFLYFNSLANPIIYCMRTQDFRRAFRELLNREAAQVNVQELDNDLGMRRRRRKSEARRSSRKNIRIAPSDPALARDSRALSLSLDLSRDLANEQEPVDRIPSR